MEPIKYFQPLKELFLKYADEDDAFYMKKYLKNQFEFFGLRKVKREAAEKEFFSLNELPSYGQLDSFIGYLWNQPEREFQHFGLIMTKKYLKNATPDFISVIENMIKVKSWWDTVDFVAAHHAGGFFKKFPDLVSNRTRIWMDSGNMWLQRSALLFQLKYKKETDFELMQSYILELAGSKEFFIRKAIGWVLREYSKTDPERVIKFTESAPISNFSKKEAMKWLERGKPNQV